MIVMVVVHVDDDMPSGSWREGNEMRMGMFLRMMYHQSIGSHAGSEVMEGEESVLIMDRIRQ